MKTVLRSIAAAAALAAVASSASALTINFDDLAQDPNGIPFAGLYQGFDFTGWYYATDDAPNYIASSQPNSISTWDEPGSNNYEPSPVISSATPFQFVSAMFSGYPGESVAIELLLNGVRMNTLTFPGPINGTLSGTPQIVNSNYNGLVNQIVVWSNQGHYAMDDLNVNMVPEPSAYAMMAMGLATLGIAARRRNRKAS